MSETPRRRGRPKGTGIDDSATLRTVLTMLAANDDLKPTTAIRRSGITDPSVVRRLREKLKLEPDRPTATSGAQTTLQPAVPMSVAKSATKAPPKIAPARPLSAVATPAAKPPYGQDTAAHVSQTILEQQDAASTPPRQTGQARPQPEPQPASPPPTGPSSAPQASPLLPPDPQLEALRLSAEAAAAMSRLYLHCITNATQTNPLTLALTSQNMMSQWFSGLMQAQIAARQKPKT
jgi:hypothetical protein